MRTMAFAANALIILCEILGIAKSWKGRSWKVFLFYTQLSNMIVLAASAVLLLSGGSTAAVYLRYLATCMLAMTFLVTTCILVPGGGGFKPLMLSGNGLYHHTIVPVVSLISYVFWESHTDVWLLPSLITLAYGMIMLALNGTGKADGPYPFFRVKNQSVAATILWMILLFGMIAAVSLVIAKIA